MYNLGSQTAEFWLNRLFLAISVKFSQNHPVLIKNHGSLFKTVLFNENRVNRRTIPAKNTERRVMPLSVHVGRQRLYVNQDQHVARINTFRKVFANGLRIWFVGVNREVLEVSVAVSV